MLVELNHVHLQYGKHNPVFSGINLSVEPGSFHFLTGASGAGKSSLLRLIYMSEKPSSGKVKLFGQDTTYMSRSKLPSLRRRLGVIFQDFRLIPHLTALENAALPLRVAGGSDVQIRSHVIELLAWVGLEDKLDAYPAELSGGEQQRVAIARAVVNKPSLLLADEPTGNVDEPAALKLLHLFAELNKMGTAVILATHQQTLVERLGKPVLQLQRGQLIQPLARAA
ncbi:MAG: cell division ATP-binding protein FtsE [Alphaproteobacteria bacterium]|nr:cell division ATP-binding protein FtsE [Alphaproteobacteria bacterium]